MRYTKHFPAKNEDGLVALLVVGIMIILLSLTTVAFTKLMGRESQQSLDRQLSTQANYAAESGINDATDYLSKNPGGSLTSSTCDTLSTKGYAPFLGPNSTSDVDQVTCVTADSAPEQLFFQIPAGKSKIFEMSTDAPSGFGGVLFSWDNANASTYNTANYRPANTNNFLTNDTWNNTPTKSNAPVLEVSYYPMPDGNRALQAFWAVSRTIYLYPSIRLAGLASAYDSATTPDGKIVNNSCQISTNLQSVFDGAGSVYHCNTIVTPTIQPPLSGQVPMHIFVKVSSLYGTASLAVRAVDNTGGSAATGKTVAIQGAQAVLDSTGKGGADVLKRVQTIVDYRPSDIDPTDSIETVVGLCKRLEYNLTTGNPQVDDPNPDSATSPACALTP